MISTSGLSANAALSLIKNKRDMIETSIQKEVINAREISAFRERISSIGSVDELVEDYEVYSFVMKAFDLEDQMFGKAMVKKILKGDIDDKSALVNTLNNGKFKPLYNSLGFTDGGTVNENFSDPDWIESMVDRYTDQRLINSQMNDNEIAGYVLHFQQKVDGVKNWYNVLSDPKLQEFFFTAYNIPDSVKSADIDAQARTLEKRLDITTLSDPAVQQKLEKRYVALAEAAKASENLSTNPILQLFSNSSSGKTSSITKINLDGLSQLRNGKY